MIAVCGYLSIDELEVNGARHDKVPGGIVYTALGAQRAGGHAVLLATVGGDYPEQWLTWLNGEGVDTSRVARSTHPTRRALLRHAANGSRDSVSYSRADWWEATVALQPPALPADLQPAVIALSPMPPAAASAYLGRTPAVMDTSEYYVAQEPMAVLDAMRKAEILVPSREETRLLFPELNDDEAVRRLRALTGRTVIQKRGAAGLYLLSDRHPQGLAEAALAGTMEDPTGAGDSCVGAIAAGLAEGLNDEQLLKLAVRVAAKAVSKVGPKGLSHEA